MLTHLHFLLILSGVIYLFTINNIIYCFFFYFRVFYILMQAIQRSLSFIKSHSWKYMLTCYKWCKQYIRHFQSLNTTLDKLCLLGILFQLSFSIWLRVSSWHQFCFYGPPNASACNFVLKFVLTHWTWIVHSMII